MKDYGFLTNKDYKKSLKMIPKLKQKNFLTVSSTNRSITGLNRGSKQSSDYQGGENNVLSALEAKSTSYRNINKGS